MIARRLSHQLSNYLEAKMSNKVPQIRFNGYSDDWEERKLKELGDIQTGNTPPTSNLDNYSTDGVLWVTPTDIKTLVISDTAKKLSEVGVTKARIAKAGSILVTSIASIGKNTLVTMDAGFNQQINSLTPTPKNDSYFLLTQSEKWSEKMKKTAASATMQIVNKTDFSNISTSVPVHKEEQQKIGSFFKQLDDTIALHQRKLELLKEQKKGFLQKMFPKNGARVPELRFEGFTDDWEERKLGELSQDTFGGGTPKTSVTEYWNGEIPWIQSSDLSSDHLFGVLPKKHITENAVKNSATKLIPKNSIAIVTRVGVGKLAFMPYEFTSSQDFLSLSNLQVDCNFGMYSIYKMLQRELNNIQGTSIKGITKADLLDKEVIVPVEFEEQKKIGSFFKQLDNTIALHQRKLDLLKEQKKGFLQKMFV